MNKLSLKSTIVIIFLLFLLIIVAGCLKGSSSPSRMLAGGATAGAGLKGSSSSSPFPAHSNTGQELNNAIHSGKPTLVDFYTPSCPVCRVQTPIITSLKQKYSPSKLNILEINNDLYRGLLLHYSPRGYMPTLVVFDKNGNIFRIDIGFTLKEKIESQINEVLNR